MGGTRPTPSPIRPRPMRLFRNTGRLTVGSCAVATQGPCTTLRCQLKRVRASGRCGRAVAPMSRRTCSPPHVQAISANCGGPNFVEVGIRPCVSAKACWHASFPHILPTRTEYRKRAARVAGGPASIAGCCQDERESAHSGRPIFVVGPHFFDYLLTLFKWRFHTNGVRRQQPPWCSLPRHLVQALPQWLP